MVPPPATTTDQHSHIPHFDPVPSLTPLQTSLSKALPPLTMPLSAHGLFFGPHAFQNLAKHKTSLKKKKFSNLIFKNTDVRNWRKSAKFTSFFTTTQLLFIAPKLVSWTPPTLHNQHTYANAASSLLPQNKTPLPAELLGDNGQAGSPR